MSLCNPALTPACADKVCFRFFNSTARTITCELTIKGDHLCENPRYRSNFVIPKETICLTLPGRSYEQLSSRLFVRGDANAVLAVAWQPCGGLFFPSCRPYYEFLGIIPV